MSKHVKIDGLDEWEDWLDSITDEAVENAREVVAETAMKIEADAKRRTPVDTGRLRSSINTEMDMKKQGLEATVGTDVDYAVFVEFGTSSQSEQPFLIPAFTKHVKTFEEELRKAIERGMD